MANWLQDRKETILESLTFKRALAIPVIVAVVTGIIRLVPVLAKEGAPVFLGVPDWAWGLLAGLFLFLLFMVQYATRLRLRLKPEIAIQFEACDPWMRSTKAYLTAPDNPNERTLIDAIYIRVQVSNNNADTIAMGCLAQLTDVLREETPDKFVSKGYGDTLRLAWAAQPYERWHNPLDIPADARTFFDLLYVDSQHKKITVSWDQALLAHEDLFDRPGKYKFDVLVTSKNSGSVKASIGIEWTGEWSKIRAWAIE